MKKLLLLAIVLLLKLEPGIAAPGDTAQPVQTKTDVNQSKESPSLAEKKKSADTLFALCATTPTSTNAADLLLLPAAACEAYTAYIRALPVPGPDWIAFTSSKETITNLVSLIEISLKRLEQTPTNSGASLNVGPPIWAGGGAAGMDPKQIQDPVVRAEYERRIAENQQRAQIYVNRIRLERSLDSLIDDLQRTANHQATRLQQTPIKEIIKASQLPEDTKRKLLPDNN